MTRIVRREAARPGMGSRAIPAWVISHYPGLVIAAVAAVCAEAISGHYGAPPMFIALLIGLSAHFVYELESVRPGIDVASRVILRLGVALLGLKIAIADIAAIGLEPILLVSFAMAMTVVVAVIGARALGLSRSFAALSGGSVAVCGASAAVAISSILPRDEENERSLAVVIAVVTMLATLAMTFYPLLILPLGFRSEDMAVILGGTIHDVAQVVAAGKAISPRVGELATFVKLMRVALLLPVVVLIFAWLHGLGRKNASGMTGKTQFIPGFLLAFFFLAALNSFGLIPASVQDAGSQASHYFLVLSITAIGVKTDLKAVLDVGWRPFLLIVVETLAMLAVVVGGVILLR